MNKLALIKVGGSLITDKTKPLTTRDDMMKVVAKALREAHEKFPETEFIVANGAGSFGHYLASQETGSDPSERIQAVHESVVLLNRIFVQHLVDESLPAISVVPAEYIVADRGKVESFDTEEVKDVLSINSIPVLFGDIVDDDTERGMIFSTETLFEMLSDALREEYEMTILYLGETDGVLDPSGAVMPAISSDTWEQMGQKTEAPEGYDVTGGMTHKVESALRVATYAKDVRILSGKRPDSITDALSGKSIGTKITV